jgi:hypothetical protein
MTGIGRYKGNELLALHCAACPNPILPGQLYRGGENGKPPTHLDCWVESQPAPTLERRGLDR